MTSTLIAKELTQYDVHEHGLQRADKVLCCHFVCWVGWWFLASRDASGIWNLFGRVCNQFVSPKQSYPPLQLQKNCHTCLVAHKAASCKGQPFSLCGCEISASGTVFKPFPTQCNHMLGHLCGPCGLRQFIGATTTGPAGKGVESGEQAFVSANVHNLSD